MEQPQCLLENPENSSTLFGSTSKVRSKNPAHGHRGRRQMPQGSVRRPVHVKPPKSESKRMARLTIASMCSMVDVDITGIYIYIYLYSVYIHTYVYIYMYIYIY